MIRVPEFDDGIHTPDNIERILRWAKLAMQIAAIFGGWVLAVTGYVYTLHRDVDDLKTQQITQDKHIETLDQTARAIEVIRQKQIDVIATNSSQDARMRELDTKISEMQRTQIEMKFWLDQLVRSQQQQGPRLQSVPP